MSTLNLDELGMLLHERVTERGEAPSGFSLPRARLIVARGGEVLAREALKSEAWRPYFVQLFQTDALVAGSVDVTNLIEEPNRLMVDGAPTWVVTLDDDAESCLQWCPDLEALRRKRMSDSFNRRFCLDGTFIKTRDRDGSLIAIDGVQLRISGVAVPDLPDELPDPVVEFYLDLLASRFIPDGTQET